MYDETLKILFRQIPKVQSRCGRISQVDDRGGGLTASFCIFALNTSSRANYRDYEISDLRTSMKVIVVTNNNSIRAEALNDQVDYDIQYIDEIDVLAVLRSARDLVHKGHKLLTHPLSGSVKPFESPYKSIALNATVAALDMQSLQIIENAIAMATNFKKPSDHRVLTEKVLEDFKLIDSQLITNALTSVKEEDLWQ